MGLLAKATALLEAQKRAAEVAAQLSTTMSEATTLNPEFAKKVVEMRLNNVENKKTNTEIENFNTARTIQSTSQSLTNKTTTPTITKLENLKNQTKTLNVQNTNKPVVEDFSYGEFVKPTPRPVSQQNQEIRLTKTSHDTCIKQINNGQRVKLRKLVAGFVLSAAATFMTPAVLGNNEAYVRYSQKNNSEKLYNIDPSAKISDVNISTVARIGEIETTKQLEQVKEIEKAQEEEKEQTQSAATVKTDNVINEAIVTFTKGLESTVTRAEREALARMLYGEAGRGADPFEILHTVFNRASSPLFKGSLLDIVTQKNQYVGYSPKHPLTNDYLTIVDMGVDYWEAHNCEKIDGCDHYYFVQGIAGVCNEFEISPKNSNGKWVPTKDKKYAKMRNYCPVATDQAKRYYANRQAYQKA